MATYVLRRLIQAKTSGQHARFVDDQQIAVAQKVRKIAHTAVIGSHRRTAVDEEPRRVARLARRLRDRVLWQKVGGNRHFEGNLRL